MNRVKLKLFSFKNAKKYFFLLLLSLIYVSYRSNFNYSIPQTKLSLVNYDAGSSNEFEAYINEYCNVHSASIDCLHKLHKLNKLESSNPKDDCHKCLHYRNDSGNEAKLTIYHHTFWQLKQINASIDAFYSRVIKLNLMSFLATQNLCCTKFIFWKLDEFPLFYEAELNKTFRDYISTGIISMKTFYLNELCSSLNSSFKHTKICNQYKEMDLSSSRLIALSDLVRFLVLELYGGIYTDVDLVYLKDLRPFWNYNFAYRWALSQNLNTAVLGINRKLNPGVYELYDYALNRFSVTLAGFLYLFHPYKISNAVSALNNGDLFSYKQLKVFNCLLFDPAWVCFDSNNACGFSEFSQKRPYLNGSRFDPGMFYSGAYTYHLHLKDLGCRVEDFSFFQLFEDYYMEVLNLKS